MVLNAVNETQLKVDCFQKKAISLHSSAADPSSPYDPSSLYQYHAGRLSLIGTAQYFTRTTEVLVTAGRNLRCEFAVKILNSNPAPVAWQVVCVCVCVCVCV